MDIQRERENCGREGKRFREMDTTRNKNTKYREKRERARKIWRKVKQTDKERNRQTKTNKD